MCCSASGHTSCWDMCIQSQDIVWETWACSPRRSKHHCIISSRRTETQASGSSTVPEGHIIIDFSMWCFALSAQAFWMLSDILFMFLRLLCPQRQSKPPGHTAIKTCQVGRIQLEKLPRQPGSSAEGTKIQDLRLASQAGVFIQQSGSRKRVLWGRPRCFLWAEDFVCFPASWPWTLTFHFWICN